MKIAVYCSANNGLAPEIYTLTEEFGRWIGSNGHTLVFGGCNMGMMECVAKAVHDAGGRAIGVIPDIIEKGGRISEYVDIHIPCDSLSSRKDLFMAQSDVHVVLPGGIGTLDELFMVAASASIGYHSKRVIIYNMCGYWDALVGMLDDLERKGAVRGEYSDYIKVVADMNQMADAINGSK